MSGCLRRRCGQGQSNQERSSQNCDLRNFGRKPPQRLLGRQGGSSSCSNNIWLCTLVQFLRLHRRMITSRRCHLIDTPFHLPANHLVFQSLTKIAKCILVTILLQPLLSSKSQLPVPHPFLKFGILQTLKLFLLLHQSFDLMGDPNDLVFPPHLPQHFFPLVVLIHVFFPGDVGEYVMRVGAGSIVLEGLGGSFDGRFEQRLQQMGRRTVCLSRTKLLLHCMSVCLFNQTDHRVDELLQHTIVSSSKTVSSPLRPAGR